MVFVRLVLLLASGLVAGATVCVLLLEHAFAGPAASFTELKQLEIRAFTVPLTSLGVVVLVAGFAYAAMVRRDRRALALTLAGLLCAGIGGVITARVHFPMNDRVASWSAASPRADWAEVRDRWRRAHDLRTAVTVLGFGFFLLGSLPPRSDV